MSDPRDIKKHVANEIAHAAAMSASASAIVRWELNDSALADTLWNISLRLETLVEELSHDEGDGQ